MKLDFENWKAGKFAIDNSTITKLSPSEFKRILDHSILLIKEKGKEQFDSLKTNFQKKNSHSIDKQKEIKIQIKLYEALLSISIKKSDQGYLEGLGLYRHEREFDAQFVRCVQICYTRLLRGDFEILISNPKSETYDDGNVSAAIAAFAWPLYINYLKGELKTKTSAQLPALKEPEPLFNNKIFASYKAFQLFEACKNEMVKDATEYADYSRLFDELKRDKLILPIKHKLFLEFLGEVYKVKCAKKYTQLKTSNSRLKKTQYAQIKARLQIRP